MRYCPNFLSSFQCGSPISRLSLIIPELVLLSTCWADTRIVAGKPPEQPGPTSHGTQQPSPHRHSSSIFLPIHRHLGLNLSQFAQDVILCRTLSDIPGQNTQIKISVDGTLGPLVNFPDHANLDSCACPEAATHHTRFCQALV